MEKTPKRESAEPLAFLSEEDKAQAVAQAEADYEHQIEIRESIAGTDNRRVEKALETLEATKAAVVRDLRKG